MKTSILRWWIVTALLVGVGSASAQVDTTASNSNTPPPATGSVSNQQPNPDSSVRIMAPSTTTTVTPQVRSSGPAPGVSYAASEIVKMRQSGVETPVIQAYIENSKTIQPPTADELIYLHDQGIPSEIITAYVRKGNEAKAAAPTAPTGNENQNYYQPAPVVPQAPAVTQSAPAYYYYDQTPNYSYAPSYPYYYDYPYSYGGAWPYWWSFWYSSPSILYYPYRSHGFYHRYNRGFYNSGFRGSGFYNRGSIGGVTHRPGGFYPNSTPQRPGMGVIRSPGGGIRGGGFRGGGGGGYRGGGHRG